jgi:predicted transcriptional regulator
MKKNKGFWSIFNRKDPDEEQEDIDRLTKVEAEIIIVMTGVEQLASALEELAQHVKNQREVLSELVEEHNSLVTALKQKSSTYDLLDRKSNSKPN